MFSTSKCSLGTFLSNLFGRLPLENIILCSLMLVALLLLVFSVPRSQVF